MKEEQEIYNSMKIVIEVLSKNEDYFMDDSIIEVKVENKKGLIKETEGLFDENISMAAICLNLIHNISMLHCFSFNFAVENSFDILNYTFNETDDFYLKLSISPNSINIEKRKGFGLFAYNVDDMAATLNEVIPAFKIYLNEKISQDEKLKDLKRVLSFIDYIEKGLEPNAAMSMFITENKDLYKNYINLGV